MIRLANPSDEDDILVMARDFAAFAPHQESISATDDELRDTIRWFMQNATMFVADKDGSVVGMLVALLSPVWYAPRFTMATELAWWVNPKHRRGLVAIRLLQAFESWARDNGATIVNMSNLQTNNAGEVSAILNRLGYSVSEQTHSKRI